MDLPFYVRSGGAFTYLTEESYPSPRYLRVHLNRLVRTFSIS